jgi:hypothetical protein
MASAQPHCEHVTTKGETLWGLAEMPRQLQLGTYMLCCTWHKNNWNFLFFKPNLQELYSACLESGARGHMMEQPQLPVPSDPCCSLASICRTAPRASSAPDSCSNFSLLTTSAISGRSSGLQLMKWGSYYWLPSTDHMSCLHAK